MDARRVYEARNALLATADDYARLRCEQAMKMFVTEWEGSRDRTYDEVVKIVLDRLF